MFTFTHKTERLLTVNLSLFFFSFPVTFWQTCSNCRMSRNWKELHSLIFERSLFWKGTCIWSSKLLDFIIMKIMLITIASLTEREFELAKIKWDYNSWKCQRCCVGSHSLWPTQVLLKNLQVIFMIWFAFGCNVP